MLSLLFNESKNQGSVNFAQAGIGLAELQMGVILTGDGIADSQDV